MDDTRITKCRIHTTSCRPRPPKLYGTAHRVVNIRRRLLNPSAKSHGPLTKEVVAPLAQDRRRDPIDENSAQSVMACIPILPSSTTLIRWQLLDASRCR